jgi:cytochrome c553
MTLARLFLFALALFALLVGTERGRAADVAAGKALAQACTPCHGRDGISRTPLTPSLAGEPDYFIQWQLVYFRGGSRKSAIMQAIAKSLSNEDIRNLGAYYASLGAPKPQPAAGSDALAQAGEKLAAAYRCKSCHGDGFAGVGPTARLAGQREDVLLKALRDFKSGARIGTGIASMADVVYPLSDDDMKALAHYMSSRP